MTLRTAAVAALVLSLFGCGGGNEAPATVDLTANQTVQFRNSEDVLSIANVQPGPYNLTVYAGAAPVARPIEVKDAKTDLGLIQ